MSIKRLKISGFKSIDTVDLTEIACFSAFAGSNGAGKSNFFDALVFVSAVIRNGAIDAIRQFGGYEHIHCYKKRSDNARNFQFELEIELEKSLWTYTLKITDLDKSTPTLVEALKCDNESIIQRKSSGSAIFGSGKDEKELPKFPSDRSALMFAFNTPIVRWLYNIRVFRIDPIGAKKPNAANADGSVLDTSGENVAAVMAALEKNDLFRETILDLLVLVVPGLRGFSTERERLSGQTVLKFAEAGTKGQFPANLISDGTVYLLCILTAILSRSQENGLTLIEEPERGINPKPIAEIVNFMREQASNEHPIWVTTHNETLVRSSQPSELIFVQKIDGKTQFKPGRDSAEAVAQMPLDKAWLSNMFDGGLPW